MLRSKALILDERFGREYAGHYVFGAITWAKRSRIIQKHTKYSKATGRVECSDLVAIQAETVIASLKEQPENRPVTLEKLLDESEGVPVDLGELLGNLANRLCNVSKEETVFFVRAIRRKKPNTVLTEFRLCKEFGWTPSQLGNESARKIQQFLIILNEIDMQTETEVEKTKHEARTHGH